MQPRKTSLVDGVKGQQPAFTFLPLFIPFCPLHPSSFLSYPSFSHQSVEGQRARGLHHKGQPFLPWSLRPCHEGGLPAANCPAEQKR